MGVLGLVLGLAACRQQEAAQPAKSDPAEVGIVTVHPQAVTLTTELPGRTEAYLISEVRPQVTGIIKARNFVEGHDVEAGEQLYQIDPATYQSAVDSAAASLARAEASNATAEAKAKRYTDLVSRDVVSRQTYDDAIATSNETKADIAGARASLNQAKINLAYTQVRAPISGRIGRSLVTPGALVTANQAAAIATVTQLDPIYVDVMQSATNLLRLKRALGSGRLEAVGADQAKVTLKLDDGSDYPESGTLRFSEVNVSQSTGTVLVRATFPNPHRLLLPGMFVHAQISEAVDSKAFVVPQRAVSRNEQGEATVLIVQPDETVARRRVEAQRAVADTWIVSGGLDAGNRVIVDGIQHVKPGDHVRAVAAKKE